MTNETITLVAESAPFWGVWTTVWTIVAVAVIGLFVVLSVLLGELLFTGMGVYLGVVTFLIGAAASAGGVEDFENSSLQQQLQEVVRVENLEYNNKDFTSSIDGRYVKGTLVHLGGREYQVVELVTESKGD